MHKCYEDKKMILKNCKYIITQDKDRLILENQDIEIINGKITKISKNINSKDTDVHDFSNKVVMPGMINTHAHLPMTLFRGYSDDLGLHDWLKKMLAMEAKLTKEHVYWGTKLGLLEGIQFGTTTFADFYYFPYKRAEAMIETGVNGFLDSAVHDMPGFFKTPQHAIDHSEKFIKDMLKEKKVTPIATAHSIYLCSKDTLQQMNNIAKKYGVLKRIHVSETEKEFKKCLKDYKATPVEFLNNLNWVDEKTMLVHANWVTNHELRIIRNAKAKINHNPISNMKLAYGKAMPLRRMIDMGITVSLATDGPTSNNNLDLFDDMKVSALMHKFEMNDPIGIMDQEIFDMANIKGAEALMIENETGSLEIGKNADIIAMDLNEAVFTPLNSHNNIISHLIYAASGSNVTDTIVKGKFLYKDKKFLTLDKNKIIKNVQRLMGGIETQQ
jgi:5-methylthioadenosine/S-adenosylhomocysteine deaminase